MQADELDEAVRELGDAGRRVVGVVDFSPPFSSAGDPAPPPFGSTLPRQASSPLARRYHLSTFLAGIVLPPSSLPPRSPITDPPDPSAHLLAATRRPLDILLDLLSRRLARLAPTSTPTAFPQPPPPPTDSTLFVLSAPGAAALEAGDEAAQRQAEDLVPLVLALERCRMWSGEGWAAVEGED